MPARRLNLPGNARGNRSERRRDRGAAMVEFALVVPLFLALVLGIISYGYMLSYRQAVTQAAMEGARAAALAPAGADLHQRALENVNQSLAGYDITCTEAGALTRNGSAVGTCDIPDVTETCPAPNTTGTSCVIVRIAHDYRDKPLVPSFPGLGIVLPEQVAYRAVVEAN